MRPVKPTMVNPMMFASCVVALVGCAEYPNGPPRAGTTTTTTVVRDAYGNPIARDTTVRDADGNPVYSGASLPPAAAPCQATPLHQDRPGGSDYNPYRGVPSC